MTICSVLAFLSHVNHKRAHLIFQTDVLKFHFNSFFYNNIDELLCFIHRIIIEKWKTLKGSNSGLIGTMWTRECIKSTIYEFANLPKCAKVMSC